MTFPIVVAAVWTLFLIVVTYAERLRARRARLAEARRRRGPSYPAGRGGEGWVRLDWPAHLDGEPPYTYAHPQFRWAEILESDGYRWGRFAS